MTTIADIHRPAPGMPHVAPRAMPTQDLRSTPTARPRPATPLRIRLARLIAFGGAAAIAGYGAYEMVSVVSAGGITQIEWLFTLLFAVNFTWIAFAASPALAGLLAPPARRHDALATAKRLSTRTALVMPVYHEPAAATAAALEVMARGLAD